MKRSIRMATLLAVLVLASGCAVWQPQRVRADHLVATRGPQEIRVGLRNGSRVVIVEPKVVGEVLVGWQRGEKLECQESEHISIPLNEIVSCELRGGAGGSAILVGTGLVVVVLGLVAIGMSE
jgi:hypothetical protein